MNAPDNYFSAGANKMMFYGDPSQNRRARLIDLLLSRQMLFDGTYEWLSTQGWALVPIENYDGGGSEVAFAPLEVNLEDYDLAWATYMGYGVSGVCWRGNKFFDGPKSQTVVTQWVKFYKRYRDILTNGGLVHVRRPDGQGLDAVLHTNADNTTGAVRGLLFVFNPTATTITAGLPVSMYYTGLDTVANVFLQDDGAPQVLTLARDYSVTVQMSVPAGGYAWFIVR